MKLAAPCLPGNGEEAATVAILPDLALRMGHLEFQCKVWQKRKSTVAVALPYRSYQNACLAIAEGSWGCNEWSGASGWGTGECTCTCKQDSSEPWPRGPRQPASQARRTTATWNCCRVLAKWKVLGIKLGNRQHGPGLWSQGSSQVHV